MDTRIKVQEIRPKVTCGPGIVREYDSLYIIDERIIDISDDELMRLAQRVLELIGAE